MWLYSHLPFRNKPIRNMESFVHFATLTSVNVLLLKKVLYKYYHTINNNNNMASMRGKLGCIDSDKSPQ